MAKSNSPIRLDAALMSQAKLVAGLHKRSQAEQIEYWAALGQSMTKLIDPETLIRIKSGVTKIRLEDIKNNSIDPEDVFSALEEQKQSGLLRSQITTSKLAYRASESKTGYLEQIDTTGNVTVGQFENGHFVSL